MSLVKKSKAGVTFPRGFKAAAVSAGLKKSGKPDLTLVVSDVPAAAGALFTTNQFPAAPVLVSQRHLRQAKHHRGVLLNAGGANACTGEAGINDARNLCAHTAALLGCSPAEILIASTGVIGARLPVPKMLSALPGVVKKLRTDQGLAAAQAIMTTDTQPKSVSTSVRVAGTTVKLGGMTKGSGMIHPNMATMLAVITTDLGLHAAEIKPLLREACRGTFNAISVDGETSTNDCVFLLANGQAGSRAHLDSAAARKAFLGALTEVADELARSIVEDGEGAGKFMDIRISGAASDAQAMVAARAVGDSQLVKTAVHGQDANWGRILSAMGATAVIIKPERVRVDINGVPLVRRGVDAGTPVAQGNRALAGRNIIIKVDLGLGSGAARYRTCDLTAKYVAINAGYRN
ncbi:MAG: bifunctional glutamate N-acetyltransferase/amino-acid acetyltransferase ArgJ [Candidatus Firestonebacteria bacterium]|nr:bifunctional glutamate N-acetyltransferase/amino-acid acetyltransferase ArgJ [Candidatus Firestonebacteria bacterium]